MFLWHICTDIIVRAVQKRIRQLAKWRPRTPVPCFRAFCVHSVHAWLSSSRLASAHRGHGLQVSLTGCALLCTAQKWPVYIACLCRLTELWLDLATTSISRVLWQRGMSPASATDLERYWKAKGPLCLHLWHCKYCIFLAGHWWCGRRPLSYVMQLHLEGWSLAVFLPEIYIL